MPSRRGRRAIRAAFGLLLVTWATAACGGDPPGPTIGFPQIGDPAPDFTLPSADGDPVSLAELRGRKILLYFSMGPG